MSRGVIVVLVVVGLATAVYLATTRREEGPSIEELIEREVASKLASWQARRDRVCRNEAMKLAEVLADSLILDYAREQKLMLERPSRPLRPEEPPLRRPSDTLTLQPFLDSL